MAWSHASFCVLSCFRSCSLSSSPYHISFPSSLFFHPTPRGFVHNERTDICKFTTTAFSIALSVSLSIFLFPFDENAWKVKEKHTKLIITCDQNRERVILRQKEGYGVSKCKERKNKRWKKIVALCIFCICLYRSRCAVKEAMCKNKRILLFRSSFPFHLMAPFILAPSLCYHTLALSIYGLVVSFVLSIAFAHVIFFICSKYDNFWKTELIS